MGPSQQKPMGGETLQSQWNTDNGSEESLTQLRQVSSSLPFGSSVAFDSIRGPSYITAQLLISQVAYALSDKLFTYSPETFDLDVAVKEWSAAGINNANGYPTSVSSMQTRSGAASIALGYIFSKDFDMSKRHIPQSILASSSSLQHLRQTLDQLSLLYSVASPLVAHIAAVDYAPASANGLVTDYASALSVAEDLGFGLVSSSSAYESQHMALFSTLLATILPTIHIYDGVNVGRDTIRVIDVLDKTGLKTTYAAVSKAMSVASKKNDVEARLGHLLTAFNGELGTAYELFEYHGHAVPETVVVAFGTVEASLASQVAVKLSNEGTKVGVVNVRVYRPFVEDAFLAALPASVRNIAVLGQVHDRNAVVDAAAHSSLYGDVLAAVSFSEKFSTASVCDIKYAREESWNPTSIAAVFRQQISKSVDTNERFHLLGANQAEQYTFWDIDESISATAPVAVGKFLSGDSAHNVFLKKTHDNIIRGGITRTDIRTSKKSIDASYFVEEADVVVVGDEGILKEVGVLQNIRAGGKLIVKLPGTKDEDLEKKFSVGVRRDLQTKSIQLLILDPTLSAVVNRDAGAESLLVEVAFLKVARPDLPAGGIEKLASYNGSSSALKEVIGEVEKALRNVEIPASWAELEADAEIPVLPRNINTNSFTGFDKSEAEHSAMLRNWEAAAKGLAFKEAHGTQSTLRPDLVVKTFTVHVKENRRLTPVTYDRNIFHIEFDLGQSGLKYDIGEALGIHAENNKHEVESFMEFYGLEPEEIVEVPSRENPEVLETRTVYQSLMQNIDIFGKPPKKFYEGLADFATDETERKTLMTLGGSEGATEFKRRSEVDTLTYADVLLEFTSAHPSFHDIAQIVAPMKRREYSIASSQMVNPTTVALMIVVVGWVDPRGRDRFGQATRYLSALPIGSSVTVSVKPSVMKLPVKDTAPLIMAGLGTGLAPFRAFVQYRAMQKAQGKEIGSILLYMGSRHQREEYLYGEEWEAYQDAGVITLLGRAFSRDQPEKIYIQDRMRESMSDIIKAYIKEEGAFYLCGPTWPVPDVTEVLEEAISREAKAAGKKVDSRKEIERLKDNLRYVLEVY